MKKSDAPFIFERNSVVAGRVVWDVSHRDAGVYLGRVAPSTRRRRWYAHPGDDRVALDRVFDSRESAAQALLEHADLLLVDTPEVPL